MQKMQAGPFAADKGKQRWRLAVRRSADGDRQEERRGGDGEALVERFAMLLVQIRAGQPEPDMQSGSRAVGQTTGLISAPGAPGRRAIGLDDTEYSVGGCGRSLAVLPAFPRTGDPRQTWPVRCRGPFDFVSGQKKKNSGSSPSRSPSPAH